MFDKFEVPYKTLHAADVQAGNLGETFDVIVFASMNAPQILNGPNQIPPPNAGGTGTQPAINADGTSRTLPQAYVGGIGAQGVENLKAFVNAGGTIVALGQSTGFAIEQFQLPVRNVLARLSSQEFYCPGSILRVNVKHPSFVTTGFSDMADIFFYRSPAFEVTSTDPAVKVLMEYGQEKLLRSGWLNGESHLANRAALVEAGVGEGRILLVGFGAQFRAQTYGTFRVLLNTLFYSTVGREPRRAALSR